ncbi:hypothetical protein BN159_5327 [Streptomyces davaonensis JCM 4913]|uniref:Uncharacterized protein n=1 Tax=Streptomyces davaonensis (strain DSM 101723 / JCM 4913 / KCC S-0913 / 768) TaxID=1214101 RepID=K4R092_STRDJ|nr:hypothetical protein [Streptomyces davaonensis]CCK29706.1 hypothetical protein BN159_5327 [Streptomyces davaonensis JCM 4913]
MTARSVIAPLGGLLEIGAVTATGTWTLSEVSLGAFLDDRRDEVDQVLADIHSLCAFGPVFLAVADELGYLRDHEVTSAFLLLWSGGVEGVPPDLSELESPMAVRRMCRAGADLQLTELLDALVTAALPAQTDAKTGARLLTGILSGVTALADGTGRCTPATAFRTWRTRCLPRTLHPHSGTPESRRAGLRAYERALDALLDP